MPPKDDFLTIFDFTFSFFKALSQDGKIINLIKHESSLLHIFYNIQKYIFTPNFTKTLWDHGGSNPWEKPGSSNAKTEQRFISPGKSRAVDNMHSFYDLSN